jgi:hypothetical protein
MVPILEINECELQLSFSVTNSLGHREVIMTYGNPSRRRSTAIMGEDKPGGTHL